MDWSLEADELLSRCPADKQQEIVNEAEAEADAAGEVWITTRRLERALGAIKGDFDID